MLHIFHYLTAVVLTCKYETDCCMQVPINVKAVGTDHFIHCYQIQSHLTERK